MATDCHRFSWGRQYLLLWLWLFAITFARLPGELLLPTLSAEDGPLYFSYYFNNRDLETIFRYKMGYLPLVQNVIGYLSYYLPIRWIPYFFAWTSYILTLISLSWFFLPCYRRFLTSDNARWAACIIAAWFTVETFHLAAITDYSMWSFLLLATLMSAVPFPDRGSGLWFTGLNTAVWGSPAALICLPFTIVHIYKEKRTKRRLMYALTALNMVTHHAIAVSGSGFPGMEQLAAAVPQLFVFTAEVFTAVVSIPGDVQASPVVIWALFTLTMIGCLMARKEPMVHAGLYFIFATGFIAIVQRGEMVRDITYSPRYAYIQAIYTLWIWVLLAHRSWEGFRKRKTGKRMAIPRAIVPVTTVAVLSVVLMWQILHPKQKTYPENGHLVNAFFERLYRIEQTNGTRQGMALAMTKPSGWQLVVNTGGPLKKVYVSTRGDDQNIGHRPRQAKKTLGAALAAAKWESTVYAAAGIYTEAITITRPVVLDGGWDEDFSSKADRPTTVDARNTGKSGLNVIGNDLKPMIRIHNVSFINGGCPSDCLGGGIRAWEVNLYLRDCRVENNLARLGGGIYTKDAFLLLERSIITGNVATDCCGGGVFLGTGAYTTIRHSSVTANRAVETGGIHGAKSQISCEACTITGNIP